MSVNPIVLSEAGKAVTESIEIFGDYLKTRETEKTERSRIRAALTTITKKIEADK
jgi:hypothetical protein